MRLLRGRWRVIPRGVSMRLLMPFWREDHEARKDRAMIGRPRVVAEIGALTAGITKDHDAYRTKRGGGIDPVDAIEDGGRLVRGHRRATAIPAGRAIGAATAGTGAVFRGPGVPGVGDRIRPQYPE